MIQNWSGIVRFTPKNVYTPETELALIALVKKCHQQKCHIRVIGSGHSFTRLIETNDTLISLDKLQGIINVDRDAHQVTVWGGTKIKVLGEHLASVGLAQINLGDIDVQSIAGAISTGTHGSGATLGSVATQVVGMRLVTASGDVIDCSETEHRDIFKAAQVSMGMLGIITQVTLQCMPAYTLDYHWYKQSLQDVIHNLDKLKQHRHFEFYWLPHTETTLVKTMNITNQPAQSKSLFRQFNENVLENLVFWGFSATARKFPEQSKRIARMMSTLISNGHDVTASHETFATVRMVKFQEMEYNIPAEYFVDCLCAIKAAITREDVSVHFPLECRFVAADDIPLSPAYQRDSAYIAVHMFKGMDYRPYFNLVEDIFRSYNGRPHWGKLHTRTAAELQTLYPQWDHFMDLRAQLDPDGCFLNDYLRSHIDVETSSHMNANQ